MTIAVETESKKIVAMDPSQVDGVTGPANGTPWLLIKSIDEPAITPEDEVMAKAADKYTDAQIEALGKKGQAFKNPDGHYSFPIADADDLGNAIKAVGRGGADHDAIRAYVIKRAKALGKSSEIPDSWASDGSMSKSTDKVDCPTCKGDGKIRGNSTDCPDCDGSGKVTPAKADRMAKDTGPDQSDPTIPGSSAWEAADADALIQAGQLLATAASMLATSANRESIEVATGHADDMADVYDLSNAIDYVTAALGIVARTAFTEEAESDAAGQMAKSARSAKNTEALNRALHLLAKSATTSGDPGTTERTAVMADLTEDQMRAVVRDELAKAAAPADPAIPAAAVAVPAAVADPAVVTDPLAKDAPVIPAPAADPAAVIPGTVELTQVPALDTEALIKSLGDGLKATVTEAVDSAVAPLQAQNVELAKQVEDLSHAARPGGLAAAPRSVSLPAQRGATGAAADVDITGLQDQLAKSVDPIEQADLTQRIFKFQYAQQMFGLPIKSA